MLLAEHMDRIRAGIQYVGLEIGNRVWPICDRLELWLRDHLWFQMALDTMGILLLGALFLLAIVTLVY